ncbi:hypothetical protein AXG93_2841s1200 [Marchantia polymorpha subsp. ruderalis]|uniref:Retrotransposon gag domain-containing protein n=1 Tax=Marchantia polymorpha subsp. ruderalis TaxID=1480154 RepID=A0A176WTF8_MARPO|nr:hypothetical protein AXG93_2841s1200 [Marchantia polymorpha subsp. ruderalis]
MGKLPVFYGRENEDVEAFVRDFKRACIGNNERKKVEWAMLLPDFLEDSALKWYQEYKREHVEEDTWETLTESLIENFLPNESYEKLMCEVTFLKQGENKKVMTNPAAHACEFLALELGSKAVKDVGG